MPQTTGKNAALGRPPERPSSGGGPRGPAPGRSRIGPIGKASRVLAGLGLLYLGVADGASWGLAWHEVLLGLVAFPAVMLVFGLGAQLFAEGPVRFDGPSGIAANTAAIVALVLNDYTASAAALFYGATLLAAAWRAQPGCEITVLSNWILQRDDQIGCPTFTAIDEAEARLAARNSQARATMQPVAADEHRAESLGGFGIAHLVACCGVGAAAVAVFTLIGVLT